MGSSLTLAQHSNRGGEPSTLDTEATATVPEFKVYPNPTQKVHARLQKELKVIEKDVDKKFGDLKNPLLLSVRSGARVSMPGMMDTILNLGLNDKTVNALALKTSNGRFAKDSYRRFIQMYGNVVMGVESYHFEELIENYKLTKGVLLDTDLDESDWDGLIVDFKRTVKEKTKKSFPQNVFDQLLGAIGAVFLSWESNRAKIYRKLNNSKIIKQKQLFVLFQ